jgi:serine protease SohB
LEFFSEYAMFLLKCFTVVIAIGLIIAIASSKKGATGTLRGHINLTNLSEQYLDRFDELQHFLLDKKQYKELSKRLKDESKQTNIEKNRLFVIKFDGDIKASAVESLREEVSAILSVAEKTDEVVVLLNSPGGMVHTYGLAASQLKRLSDFGLKLVISVDECAASGGYLMASVGNKIIAAPFAIIGSIGVLAQLPNFNKLLKKNHVEYEQHTAGQFKRTISMFGENTEEGREKFKQELEDTHELFKKFVSSNRRKLDIDSVATGEHWYGSQAIELGLIDEIVTSDDFLLSKVKNSAYQIIKVEYELKKPLSEKISEHFALFLSRVSTKLSDISLQSNLFK